MVQIYYITESIPTYRNHNFAMNYENCVKTQIHKNHNVVTEW